MVEYATREFELNATDEHGGTLRDDAQSLERQGAFVPPEYLSLPFPDLVSHIWEWFIELHRCRTSNGFGVNPITYIDIDAWSRLTRRKPTALEIRAITQIDAAFLTVQAKQSQKKKGK